MEYPKTVAAGSMLPIHMWWLNAGVAPAYTNYPLAVELSSANDSGVINVPVDVRKWLPGDAVFDGSLFVPDTLPEGTYDVRVAMLDPRTSNPAVRFAIAGRDPDGWYSEGQIRAATSASLPTGDDHGRRATLGTKAKRARLLSGGDGGFDLRLRHHAEQ